MSYASTILSDNPIRFFRLSDASGVVVDDSSTSNADGSYLPESGGAWTGGLLGVSGANAGNSAAQFDGLAGYADVGDVPIDSMSAVSVELWLKKISNTADRFIFAKSVDSNNAFELFTGSPGFGDTTGLVVVLCNGGVAYGLSGPLFSENVWYHVVLVFDGSGSTNADRIKLYIDSASVSLDFTGTIPATTPVSAASMFFCGKPSGRNLNAVLDDISIYGYALSGSQVAAHYAARDIPTAPPVISSMSIPDNGSRVDLVFSEAVTGVSASEYLAVVDDDPVAIDSVSGSGTSWSLNFGSRWVLAGSTADLSYTGSSTQNLGFGALETFSDAPVDNDSEIVRDQVGYVGRHLGMMVAFGINTFAGEEWTDGSVPANTFAPTDLDGVAIEQWIDCAEALGAGYLVLTTKHHDGFCLWPSATTDYDLASTTWYSSTPFDIAREYAKRIRARGLGVGFYFSIWDRNWEAAHPGYTGSQYLAHLKAQLTELLTRNGPVDAIWLDGWGWNGSTGYITIPYAEIYNHIKAIQPSCVMLENSHEGTLAHTDISIWEVPIEGMVPNSNVIPAEVVDTIIANGYWFWTPGNTALDSASSIRSAITTANSRRASFLLNVPPSTTGLIPESFFRRCAEVGAGGMKRLSESKGGGINGSAILGLV